jgi:hypothetical protein
MYKLPLYQFLTKASGAALALLIILAGLAVGCRSTKTIRKVMATPIAHPDTTGAAARIAAAPVRDVHADSMAVIAQTLGQLTKNRIDFQTFSAHMHVHYEESDGKDNEFNAVIHLQKDSIIWVSINFALGIEAFRILITPDSVKVIDKIKKIARLRSVSALKDEVHLPMDFKTLQDLLIGNPIFLDTTHILYYKTEPKGISLFSIGAIFRNYLTLNTDRTLQHSKLDDNDPLQVRSGDMIYGDYDFSGPVPFPRYRRISVVTKAKVDVEISYSKQRFNEVLSYSFGIPKNYKRR